MNINGLFSSDKHNYLSLSLIWLLIIFIVNPIGDFPLNDDWSYAVPVKSLLDGNGIKFTGWMSMTLFSQVLWGALWCKIFGFSFTVLRFSTLFLGWIGVIYSYKLICQFSDNKLNSFLFTLLVAFNPIYVNLSFTFMTDVPFYAFSVVSICHYLKYVENRSGLKDLIFGLLFMLISVLTRQIGLAIPLAFLVIGVFKWLKYKKFDIHHFYPFVLGFVVFLSYQYVAREYFEARGRYDEMNDELLYNLIHEPHVLALNVFKKCVMGLIYICWFITPLLFVHLIKNKKYLIFSTTILGVIWTALLYKADLILPILSNIIYDFGLGPISLYDALFYENQTTSQFKVTQAFWIIITGLVSVLMFYVLYLFFKNRNKIFGDEKLSFILSIILIYVPVLCVIYTFDRYYIFTISLSICLYVSFVNINFNKQLYSFMTFLILLFSIAGTKDYLNRNRVRWSITNHLVVEEYIPSIKIDGGFEFNGYLNYNDEDFNKGLRNLWANDTDYLITLTNLKGTEQIYSESYFSWVWMKEVEIKVLKKNRNFEHPENLYY